ncbi:MAG: NAD(P)-dependent oxidoreductase [Candidatus Cloacimonetes bacterium]|nr:NAD(P)-dependent oxidoreductase [Candidatus Cloacimonadota bacterium]
MLKNILITYGSSLLARYLAIQLAKKNYRCNLLNYRIVNKEPLPDNDNIHESYLNPFDIKNLRHYLQDNAHDAIIHLNEPPFCKVSHKNYLRKLYVDIPEQLAINAITNKSLLIYITPYLPGATAHAQSETADTEGTSCPKRYHQLQIHTERLLQKYILYGLEAYFIKYFYLYGNFQKNLLQDFFLLVEKKRFLLPDQELILLLSNIEGIVDAIKRIFDRDIAFGATNLITDRPVTLGYLINEIYKLIHKESFPDNRIKKPRTVRIFNFLIGILNPGIAYLKIHLLDNFRGLSSADRNFVENSDNLPRIHLNNSFNYFRTWHRKN